jgi:hypothetical protein
MSHLKLRWGWLAKLTAALTAQLGLIVLMSISGQAGGADQRAPLSTAGVPAPAPAPIADLHAAETPQALATIKGPPSPTMTAGDPLGAMEAVLLQRFPEAFGGLYGNPDGSLSVVVVGNDPQLERSAQSMYDELPADYGVGVPSSLLTVHDVKGTYPLRELYAVRDQVSSHLPGSGAGLRAAVNGVWAVGVDTVHDRVLVDESTPDSSNTSPAAIGTVSPGVIETEVSVPPTVIRRTDNPSPRFSGDQIVGQANGGEIGCTLGWGFLLTTSRSEGNLTAGHCGEYGWHNTSFGDPSFTTSNFVGNGTDGYTQKIDEELIFGHPTPYFWTGSAAIPTGPARLSGWDDPPPGTHVCESGSFGGESCGTVIAQDVHAVIDGENLYDLNITTGISAIPGDSGGPEWWSSPIRQPSGRHHHRSRWGNLLRRGDPADSL